MEKLKPQKMDNQNNKERKERNIYFTCRKKGVKIGCTLPYDQSRHPIHSIISRQKNRTQSQLPRTKRPAKTWGEDDLTSYIWYIKWGRKTIFPRHKRGGTKVDSTFKPLVKKIYHQGRRTHNHTTKLPWGKFEKNSLLTISMRDGWRDWRERVASQKDIILR